MYTESNEELKRFLLQSQAATSFQIAIQGKRDKYLADLASGAGGDYRYLLRMFDENSRRRIQSVGLVRRTAKLTSLVDGWNECTMDINQGRKGHYLYLCWKYIAV